ncbi:response regulator [Pacificibacter marinus]|uniref:Transcriptional regulatory protein DegU n=1 Tax=Pacificibacter marinus TaxID=658057 RepID=A0A1Y5RNL1_9RHOB|nr:response regulator transcription factor [Pacificibacter marinus]SEK18119.1 two component transcriptional regulator, LuxR family [Pacificibacter marinus]SLN19071.1 Transcriptional regulatory protein DegU [Pacificibacter marinus]
MPLSLENIEINKKISILIADDHSLLADALSVVLSSEPDLVAEVCGTLGTTLELLQHGSSTFDIVMLDISMPGMEGLVSVKRVIDAAQGAAVVVFSGTADDDFVWQAIELGAKGFISKQHPFKSFTTILRLIADGHEFIPLSLSRRGALNSKIQSQIDDRERHILQFVAEGKTNKVIALEMNSTEGAIKMKMRTVCNKLNAKNRTHAVMVARQKCLI